jgi:hypothetical protein
MNARTPEQKIEWATDVSQARWLEEQLRFFMGHVGSLVPEEYEAYARIFHPRESSAGRERWADIAARNGRIAHPLMQFPNVSSPHGAGPLKMDLGPSPGHLPLPERQVLVEHLAGSTTLRCWFAVWEGSGVDPRGVSTRLDVIQRRYLAHRGPLSLALARLPAGPDVRWSVGVSVGANASEFDHRHFGTIDQSPHMWWPEDRSWFVATEVDAASTYVGGSGHLIDALLKDGRLEAVTARPADPVGSEDKPEFGREPLCAIYVLADRVHSVIARGTPRKAATPTRCLAGGARPDGARADGSPSERVHFRELRSHEALLREGEIADVPSRLVDASDLPEDIRPLSVGSQVLADDEAPVVQGVNLGDLLFDVRTVLRRVGEGHGGEDEHDHCLSLLVEELENETGELRGILEKCTVSCVWIDRELRVRHIV